jgi:hypothetical protein
MVIVLLKLQKINSIFLVIVLITAAITLGISTFIDDAFALGDNYNKKEFRYINDSYDKEPDDKKYNKYDIKYPKDENFAIVLDNNLNNNYESPADPDKVEFSYESKAVFGR